MAGYAGPSCRSGEGGKRKGGVATYDRGLHLEPWLNALVSSCQPLAAGVGNFLFSFLLSFFCLLSFFFKGWRKGATQDEGAHGSVLGIL